MAAVVKSILCILCIPRALEIYVLCIPRADPLSGSTTSRLRAHPLDLQPNRETGHPASLPPPKCTTREPRPEGGNLYTTM